MKTKEKVTRFFFVGVGVTLFDYIACMIFSTFLPLTIASICGGILATFVSYFSHKNITWKQREMTTWSIAKFFMWNALTMIAIRPLVIAGFGLLTWLYQFAFSICGLIHLPFSYEFVENTGIYVLAAIITMIINYLFYDKVVFGEKKTKEKRGK